MSSDRQIITWRSLITLISWRKKLQQNSLAVIQIKVWSFVVQWNTRYGIEGSKELSDHKWCFLHPLCLDAIKSIVANGNNIEVQKVKYFLNSKQMDSNAWP